jgi:hypothetical protein
MKTSQTCIAIVEHTTNTQRTMGENIHLLEMTSSKKDVCVSSTLSSLRASILLIVTILDHTLQTLKRWEEAERQRRRAARESIHSSHSVIGDVSKRVSSIWSNATSTRPRPGRGSYKLKDSSEDASRDSHSFSPAPTRSNSAHTVTTLQERREYLSPTSPSSLVLPEHPEPEPSPFVDAVRAPNGTAAPSAPISVVDRGPFMDPISIPPTPMLIDDGPPPSARPMLQAAESTESAAEPPRKSIPSRIDPLKPNVGCKCVRGPSSSCSRKRTGGGRRKTGRWWTDWMYGCHESGGEGSGQVHRLLPGSTAPDSFFLPCCAQAGRTNPFE